VNDNTLNGLLEAIDRLTLPIKDPVWQDEWDDTRKRTTGRNVVTVNRDPLLMQLRKAIASSTSAPANPVSGSGAKMGGLNLAAFALYETIDGRIRAAWGEMRGEPSKALSEAILRKWYLRVRNLHESNQMPESFILEWTRITRGWVRQIESMFNPEVVKELVGACPECETARVTNREGEEQSALYLHYSTDNSPEAVCRMCGWNVSGERGLLELGYHLGATVDEEALREMGVIA
jgi:hypothetical protein